MITAQQFSEILIGINGCMNERFTKILSKYPIGSVPIRQNKDCSCGANQYKNGKCEYCGTKMNGHIELPEVDSSFLQTIKF